MANEFNGYKALETAHNEELDAKVTIYSDGSSTSSYHRGDEAAKHWIALQQVRIRATYKMEIGWYKAEEAELAKEYFAMKEVFPEIDKLIEEQGFEAAREYVANHI